jgi:hypothetical protein
LVIDSVAALHQRNVPADQSIGATPLQALQLCGTRSRADQYHRRA